MIENIKFKENIEKLKNSTSTKKWFKKSNPNVRLCFLVLPKRFQSPVNYILASIEKDTFYHKDIRPDIWSKDSVVPYDIMSACSSKFSSETTVCHYNKLIKELVDSNIIYEYRYCYSKKHNITIRLFCIESKIYQWKYWDNSTPILPSSAVRIIRSNREVCKKICNIIKQINRNFTLEKAMINFANYVYKKIITKMSPDILKVIKPFSEMKKEISACDYLNSYLINKLYKFGKYYGLKEDIIPKIMKKNPELIHEILDLNKSENFLTIKEYNAEKTLLALKKDSISCKRKNAFSSTSENEANQLISNELEKIGQFPTDILSLNKDLILYNIKNNNKNKEYNKEMKRKKKIDIKEKKEDDSLIDKKTENSQMQDMCINDIVPKNDSFQKQHKKRKVVTGEKKYRSHKDGWFFNGLTGDTFGSPKDFIKRFKKTITKYHKVEFPNLNGAYQREINCASYTMDDLIKRDCNNDAVVTEWMEWYAQVYLTNKKLNDPKFLLVEFLRKSWMAFDKVRRKDILIVNPEKSSIINEKSISFRINKMFNDDYSEDNILKALRFFGVIIVSNYLQNKFRTTDGKTKGECNREEYNVVNKIDSIFEKIKQEKNRESIIVSIFNSTCKFLCDFTNNKNTMLKDWVEKYNNIWLLGGCSFNFYKKNNILIESEKVIAEEFFGEIYGNVERK